VSFEEAVRDGLPNQVLKVAALAAMVAFFEEQYTQARQDAQTAFRTSGIKKIGIKLPDGEEVGEITVKEPTPAIQAIDEDALVGHVERFTPGEIEEYLDPAALLDQELIEYCRTRRDDLLKKRVRQVWRDEMKKQALKNDGFVIDEVKGESTKVATIVKPKADGSFALAADKYGQRADRLMTELLAGRLGNLVELPTLDSPAIESEPAPAPPVSGFGDGPVSGGFGVAEFGGGPA
jgi:hypothetical protein